MSYSPDKKLSKQELGKRMSPEDFEKYKQYSTLKEKFETYEIRDITKEEWDIIKGLLFKQTSDVWRKI